MKVKILCHHLFINGSFAHRGSVVELPDETAAAMLKADEQAGRSARIEMMDKPKRKRRTRAQMIADGDVASED